MSFHQDFHESKRDRKYYESKKQNILRVIAHFMDMIRKAEKGGNREKPISISDMNYLYNLVNKL